MSIRTLRQVEADISPVPVYPNCTLRKGQSVMFTNDYGVTFGPHKIIGFCKGDGLLFKYGKHVYLDFDSYWCPVAESSLSPVCDHDYRQGPASYPVTEYTCTKCGDSYDRDIS